VPDKHFRNLKKEATMFVSALPWVKGVAVYMGF
jgi:hypothetical protein